MTKLLKIHDNTYCDLVKLKRSKEETFDEVIARLVSLYGTFKRVIAEREEVGQSESRR